MVEISPPIRYRCSACQQIDAVIVETIPLCPACREKFTKLNLPMWLKIISGLLTLIVLYNLARMPFVISTMISSERQKSAMKVGVQPAQNIFWGSGP